MGADASAGGPRVRKTRLQLEKEAAAAAEAARKAADALRAAEAAEALEAEEALKAVSGCLSRGTGQGAPNAASNRAAVTLAQLTRWRCCPLTHVAAAAAGRGHLSCRKR